MAGISKEDYAAAFVLVNSMEDPAEENSSRLRRRAQLTQSFVEMSAGQQEGIKQYQKEVRRGHGLDVAPDPPAPVAQNGHQNNGDECDRTLTARNEINFYGRDGSSGDPLRGAGAQSAEDFINLYETEAARRGWSKATHLQQLTSSLRGQARSWFITAYPANLKGKEEIAFFSDLDTFVTAFRVKFCRTSMVKRQSTAFSTLTQKKGEGVIAYLDRVLEQAMYFYKINIAKEMGELEEVPWPDILTEIQRDAIIKAMSILVTKSISRTMTMDTVYRGATDIKIKEIVDASYRLDQSYSEIIRQLTAYDFECTRNNVYKYKKNGKVNAVEEEQDHDTEQEDDDGVEAVAGKGRGRGGKGRGRGTKPSPGQSNSNGNRPGQQQNGKKTDKFCDHCSKPGHEVAHCWILKNLAKARKSKQASEVREEASTGNIGGGQFHDADEDFFQGV